MIDLYTWTTPNGRKVSILLEELGVEYTAHPINIGKDEQKTPEFLAISPNNKIPAIVDQVTGLTLMESGAIMMYLAEKYQKFLPTGAEERTQILEWLFWQTGNQGPMMGQHSHFFNYAPEEERHGYGRKRYEAESIRCMAVLNSRLEDREWLVGDAYSIADIINFPWALITKAMDLPLADYPHLARWRQAVKERPAVQRGVALGKQDRRQKPPTEEERKILFGQKR